MYAVVARYYFQSACLVSLVHRLLLVEKMKRSSMEDPRMYKT